MPKEIHYHKHEHRHFEAENVNQAIVNLGDNNILSQSITANPEIQATLAQLSRAVEAMLPHLPPKEAQEARDDLEHLQEELEKPKPLKKWYSISLEGLKKAAQNVGEIGLPVLALAEKLISLLR